MQTETYFNKEIFFVDEKTFKPTVLQYHEEKLFETMLSRCREWERQGKIHILDVRNSQY